MCQFKIKQLSYSLAKWFLRKYFASLSKEGSETSDLRVHSGYRNSYSFLLNSDQQGWRSQVVVVTRLRTFLHQKYIFKIVRAVRKYFQKHCYWHLVILHAFAGAVDIIVHAVFISLMQGVHLLLDWLKLFLPFGIEPFCWYSVL